MVAHDTPKHSASEAVLKQQRAIHDAAIKL